jgi:methylated-DNA-[protein]-cysteine S-methyltransferase/AraC family transcriptional regulator of adaptative response/methylated-DNA-[protein]-cysteine methyltransferase
MNVMNPKSAAQTMTAGKPGDDPDIIRYATGECILGRVLVARSAKGVCAILLGDDVAGLQADLAACFPKAKRIADAAAIADDLAKVARFAEKPMEGLDLMLDMRGTPFQRRVWEKLRAIRPGRTVTYQELARWVSGVASPRAVASACAANPIALAIPCHRVLRSDGDLGGFRWGVQRKRALLAREQRTETWYPRVL